MNLYKSFNGEKNVGLSLQALKVHQRTNCVNDIIQEAEDWAQATESKSANTGLLAGVPISIKDHYSMKVYTISLHTLHFVELLNYFAKWKTFHVT